MHSCGPRDLRTRSTVRIGPRVLAETTREDTLSIEIQTPGEVDAVLVPEQGFALGGRDGLLKFLEERLASCESAVIVVAEGVGAHLVGDESDSREALDGDVGDWLSGRLLQHFDGSSAARAKVSLKYVDPSYAVRAVAPNAADTILCARLASNAVHGLMAGYTEFAVGTINTHFAYIPFAEFDRRGSIISVGGDLWASLVRSTGQPSFEELDSPASYDSGECDDGSAETPAGGCVVSYRDDDDQ